MRGERILFEARPVVLAIAAVVIATACAPIALVSGNPPRDSSEALVTVQGTVTDLVFGGGNHPQVLTAFVVDDNTSVEFGPWWFWTVQEVKVSDVVGVGDEVNVTGEWEDDGTSSLCAWHIVNLTTGQELTIKEEGKPPWAGGPKALGIDPWPPSVGDD